MISSILSILRGDEMRMRIMLVANCGGHFHAVSDGQR